mmetsp:Transcript_8885/g.37612  ORF Transcript_8885/g.37612 Transcript_8885/m.37612 type:complete len:280 (-) Transcript_8885:1275-2114(-)
MPLRASGSGSMARSKTGSSSLQSSSSAAAAKDRARDSAEARKGAKTPSEKVDSSSSPLLRLLPARLDLVAAARHTSTCLSAPPVYTSCVSGCVATAHEEARCPRSTRCTPAASVFFLVSVPKAVRRDHLDAVSARHARPRPPVAVDRRFSRAPPRETFVTSSSPSLASPSEVSSVSPSVSSSELNRPPEPRVGLLRRHENTSTSPSLVGWYRRAPESSNASCVAFRVSLGANPNGAFSFSYRPLARSHRRTAWSVPAEAKRSPSGETANAVTRPACARP